MKYLIVFLMILSNLACTAANDSGHSQKQIELNTYELNSEEIKDYSFSFQIESPESIARILHDNSTSLLDRIYLVKGTELHASDFVNNLYDFGCGVGSSLLVSQTATLREKILHNQLELAKTHPRFASSNNGGYPREYFKFFLTQNKSIEILCSRNYVNGQKTRVADLKNALAGYFRVEIEK